VMKVKVVSSGTLPPPRARISFKAITTSLFHHSLHFFIPLFTRP
jgi:hypothetical protein